MDDHDRRHPARLIWRWPCRQWGALILRLPFCLIRRCKGVARLQPGREAYEGLREWNTRRDIRGLPEHPDDRYGIAVRERAQGQDIVFTKNRGDHQTDFARSAEHIAGGKPRDPAIAIQKRMDADR